MDSSQRPVSERVASLCDSVSHLFIGSIRSDLETAVLVAKFATLHFTSNAYDSVNSHTNHNPFENFVVQYVFRIVTTIGWKDMVEFGDFEKLQEGMRMVNQGLVCARINLPFCNWYKAVKVIATCTFSVLGLPWLIIMYRCGAVLCSIHFIS